MSTGNLFSGLARIPLVTKNLLILNIGIWLACSLFSTFGDFIYEHLGLHYWESEAFNPAQFFTYMFLQAPMQSAMGFTHIFFNMFAVFTFGRILEQVWGSRRFLIYYIVCGIGAGLIQELAWQVSFEQAFHSALTVPYQMLSPEQLAYNSHLFASHLLTIGASGAVFALLLGFGFVFPDMPMYLFFIPIPIKAKYMVAGYAVLEFFCGAYGVMGSVAHFAHLGGMLFALPFIFYWRKKGLLNGPRF